MLSLGTGRADVPVPVVSALRGPRGARLLLLAQSESISFDVGSIDGGKAGTRVLDVLVGRGVGW
jgi:hypothetical protein